MKKPLTPKAHGVLDYVFSGVQLLGPSLLGINRKASNTYRAIGAGFTVLNALTNTPVGLQKRIPFKTHQKADIGFLVGMSALSLAAPIRKDKRALAFHLGFLAVAILHYALTDYNKRS
jgi:hypothetical protein